MPPQLPHEHYRKLLLALCAAFPSRTELEKLVFLHLSEQPGAIFTVNETLVNQAFELIRWAHSNGKVVDLVAAACEANPNNPVLKEVAALVTPEIRSPAAPAAMARDHHSPQLPTSAIIPTERERVNELLAIQYDNLHKLERQKALYGGIDVPLIILNQIDRARSEIARLETLLNSLVPSPAATSTTTAREHRFPEVWKFDLSIVSDCISHIEKHQALCGFTLRCDVDAFRDSFFQRLMYASGRGRLEIITKRFTVTPKDTVDIIQKYAGEIECLKEKLQNHDLLCGVKLQSADRRKAGERARELWSALQAKFQGSYGHRLIIVLFSEVDFTPPAGMIRLESPRFNMGHVSEWIQDVAPAIGWEQRFLIEWRNYIVANSELENDTGLSVERTYSYLSRSLELLRKRPPPSPAEFLAELY